MSVNWRSMSPSTPPGQQPVSRAMNVTSTQAEATALCAKHKVSISAIEPLLSGGTRLVLANADDAAVMRKALKSKLIDGEVVRTLWVRND